MPEKIIKNEPTLNGFTRIERILLKILTEQRRTREAIERLERNTKL